MRVTVREVDGVAVVKLSGKVVLGDGDTLLREHVFELLDRDHRHILLDLHDVPTMDSAGVGELGAVYKRARNREAEIKLLTPSAKVDHLLKLFRLDEVFDTFRDEREAIASFRLAVDDPDRRVPGPAGGVRAEKPRRVP